MGSYANVVTSNLDIGPCIVNYKDTDIGATLGNCTVKFKYEKVKLTADQVGGEFLDEAIKSMDVTVETEFAQTRDKDLLGLLFPSADLNGTTPNKHLDFNNKTALRQLSSAGPLRLHPIVEDSGSLNQEMYFYLAVPTEDSQYVYGPGEQAKLKIMWRIYTDLSSLPDAPRIFRMGNEAL